MAQPLAPTTSRRAVFGRRAILLGGAQLFAFGLISARLYRLQVEEGENLAAEGLEVITRKEFQLPERGGISDRTGRTLAFNRVERAVRLRIRDFPRDGAELARDPMANLNLFRERFGMPESTLMRIRLDMSYASKDIPAQFYLEQLATLPVFEQETADFLEAAGSERAYAIQQDALVAGLRVSAEETVREPLDISRETHVTLISGLSNTQEARVTAQLADMPLLNIATSYSRRYEAGDTDPDASVAAVSHVLGYTRRVFREDLADDNDPMLTLPGARIGAAGIERAYDRTLRGEAGATTWQITGGGRKLQQLRQVPPTKGEDLQLTIDLTLQNIATKMLAAHREACAVVMNVDNGEILAMASNPAYDVNDFVPRISTETYNGYLQDPLKPLFPRASNGAYPPGSTFKMIITLAAQIHGFTPSTTWTCKGSIEVSNQTFHCWNRRGHGDMDMYGALRESCDVWFYQAAQAIGLDKMRPVAERFGFGSNVIENFFEQSSALLPSREWKQRRKGEGWVIGDSIQFAIGQGFVSATPVQLAAMAAAIGNGGYAVRPHLVKSNGFFGKEFMGFDPRHMAVVQEGMNQVVNSRRGTARKAALELPLGPNGEVWRMAGKTGTAQVAALPPDESEDADEDRPYDLRDHALFVAYAPLRAPKYSCAVVVEHGGSGSATAAPLARDLLTATLARHSSGLLT